MVGAVLRQGEEQVGVGVELPAHQVRGPLAVLVVELGGDEDVAPGELPHVSAADFVAGFAPERVGGGEDLAHVVLVRPAAVLGVGEALAHADALWGEPRHEVRHGDVWELSGRHILVVAQLHDEHQKWTPHLVGRQFYPYPDLFLTLSQHGTDHDMLLVQPNTYLAGHLLDKHTSVHGEDSVTKMEGK